MITVTATNGAELAKQLEATSELVSGRGDNLPAQMQKAIIQLHRFVISNIEVDTSRTKQSIFMDISADQGTVRGYLATNVAYSPWVRNSNHDEQFFQYARRIEGPRVLELLGRTISLSIRSQYE